MSRTSPQHPIFKINVPAVDLTTPPHTPTQTYETDDEASHTQHQVIPDTPPQSPKKEVHTDTRKRALRTSEKLDSPKKKVPRKSRATMSKTEALELIAKLETRIVDCEKKVSISELNLHNHLRDVAAMRGEMTSLIFNVRSMSILLEKSEQQQLVLKHQVDALKKENDEFKKKSQPL